MENFSNLIKQLTSKDNLESNETLTENGALSLKSTLNELVDLFYQVLRDTDENKIIDLVSLAWSKDPLLTLKIIAYIRDCRGGKGERKCGRILLKWLAVNHKDILELNFKYFIEEFGRYDDMIDLIETDMKDYIINYISNKLIDDKKLLDENKDVSLLAKWFPSENKSKNNGIYMKVVKKMKLTPKKLRKNYLTPLRNKINIVETKMCKNQWNDINFNKVPSNAMHLYSKSFKKHSNELYNEWVNNLSNGKTKLNAEMLFPHQIVEKYYNTSNLEADPLLEAQWKIMLDKCKDYPSIENTLVLSDVSGSMDGLPMIISLTLGILISSLAKDTLKNLILTFESDPRFFEIKGDTLKDKVNCLLSAPWGGSTDFIKAINKILTLGIDNNLSNDQMPKRLIVVSDMQFNDASNNNTNFEKVKILYKKYNYEMPHIVFWNVRGSIKDIPVLTDTNNVSLVSGFSTNILKAILNNDEITPKTTMLNAVNIPRYNILTLI